MEASITQLYTLYVTSADMSESFPDNESGELFAEIRLDQIVEQATEAVKQSKTVFWNDRVLLIGNYFSTMSLSIVQITSDPTTKGSCIGCVDIVLDALLARCADNQFTILEMRSVTRAVEAEQPIIGAIRVKLKELAGIVDLANGMDAMGASKLRRFQRFGNLLHLDNAISSQKRAVELMDDGHPDKPGYLSNLGTCQHTRFERLGDLSDLENAFSHIEKAVVLTDDGHPEEPMYLTNLGITQRSRFRHLGDLSDLANSISNIERATELIDDGHTDKPTCLSNLSISQEARFHRLGDLSDLEDAILNAENAAGLTDDGNSNKPRYLSSLATCQHTRFERLGDLSDLKNAVSNIERAIELTNDGHLKNPMHLMHLSIFQRTRFQSLGDISDLEMAISNMEEVALLMDDGHLGKPTYLLNLGIVQVTCFECLGGISDLQNAILNADKAVGLTNDRDPNKANYLSHLGRTLGTRFECLGDLSDLDDAISNSEMAVKLTDDSHLHKSRYLSNLGISQRRRFERLGNLSDLENAILNLEKAADLMHDDYLAKPGLLSNLGITQKTRFEILNNLSDLENAILNITKAVDLTDDIHTDKAKYLTNLGNCQDSRFEHAGNLSNLEDAILNKERAVELTDDGHLEKPIYLSSLGITRRTRFEHFGDLSDLGDSISNLRKAVELTDDDNPNKSHYFSNLGIIQYSHFQRFGEQADLGASVSSFKTGAQLKAAYPHHALFAARQWAETSHRHGDLLSALDGYRMALELLPKDKSENLGTLAATCAIQLGHFEEAVELLDLGRSVFWQQASLLRSDLEILSEEEPELAERFERIGQRLDAGNFSGSSVTIDIQNIGVNSREVLGKERHNLVNVWEGLVDEIRKLPKFKHFLKPIPFHQLRQAVTVGEVVIINVSQHGVDALIFGATRPVEHVPLPNIDLEVLAELSDEIVLQRPVVATEETQRRYTARYLKPAMRLIWDNILVPIFHKMKVPLTNGTTQPQRRIWWYPTGSLTFIPIHAAGPGKGAADVSQLIISSYVTTFGSLLQVHKRNRQHTMKGIKFLAVSQPNTSGLCPLPQSTLEIAKLVDVVCLAGCSHENILHLHGSDATDPQLGIKSAFALHDGNLELSKIASKTLSFGQFAFLSACHSAAGLMSLPGEAMHLAAGLQFAGFPSVIATMWGIHDEDAPKVANHAYKYLLRNGMEGLDPSDAAKALNHAVLCLREDPSVTVDRWAPFIHFGI
ncbi:hypothetical protein PILCRDRAFT_8274 [Piloderma croceum F 1598]|uniref:CHAT domain-containing protein n=1 Tax=Piloderma croceum (strain F 1598) TaxID=765440 RepID=A0A0C3FS82_PILCF|nr:hypothetical protein PILCRDRAFT_8274 [Piloderma croceum F 1598]